MNKMEHVVANKELEQQRVLKSRHTLQKVIHAKLIIIGRIYFQNKTDKKEFPSHRCSTFNCPQQALSREWTTLICRARKMT